eukprot:COSAG01_NODE_54_length_31327_cov_317.045356_16_plen_54_part_00
MVFPPEFRRLREIRQDMEKLRLLTGLVHKRELTKRDYIHTRRSRLSSAELIFI